MNSLVCPHCSSRRLSKRQVPKDVVIVLPCPACSELVVLFRQKALALDRSILERGTHDERKMHVAGIIAEFLEPGLFKLVMPPSDLDPDGETHDIHFLEEAEDDSPITEEEAQDFARIQLRRIDNSDYFRRYLG